MRSKVALLLGIIAIIAVTVFSLFSVGIPKAQEPTVPTQPVATVSVLRRVVIFMGPMKPINMAFETQTFASPVSILDSNDEQTVLYYQPQDFSLNVAGQSISGTEIGRSNNHEWISVRPVDSQVEISIGDESLIMNENDVLMFNLSGQDPHPSIVMEIWRDGLFDKQNMNAFFEESNYKPVQRIPNWILDILNA